MGCELRTFCAGFSCWQLTMLAIAIGSSSCVKGCLVLFRSLTNCAVMKVLTNPHMLLVTLLLCNSAAMEVTSDVAWLPATPCNCHYCVASDAHAFLPFLDRMPKDCKT